MKGKFGIKFYLSFFIFFYSKCNLCQENDYFFNEELSNFKINNSHFSIFNSEYYFNFSLENNSNITLKNNNSEIEIQVQIIGSNVIFHKISKNSFNNNFDIIINNTFYHIIKFNRSNNLYILCDNNSSYEIHANTSKKSTLYNYQFISYNKNYFYGNFLIIFGIIISLYGYKMKFIVKVIFLIFLLNSCFEFIEERLIQVELLEVTCLEISIFCLIIGVFLGIILPKKEFISYGAIFGYTFYNTICYYCLFLIFPNSITYFQIIGVLIIIISIVITEKYNKNEILFLIGTSISGAYFIITGINCFLGGFYYVIFLEKGFYDLNKFKKNLLFYFILNILFIVVGIIYQMYYKNIETNETNEIENAKKKINKNFSGSTFIINPNKTNEYNLSLTTNNQITKTVNVNLKDISENDDNEDEKEFEDNENDNKLLNESYH